MLAFTLSPDDPTTTPPNTETYSQTFASSGFTPVAPKFSTVDDTKKTEIRNEEVRKELDGKIIELDAEAFIKTFLYSPTLDGYEADLKFGLEFTFPDALTDQQLDNAKNERDLQPMLATLMNVIRREYHAQFGKRINSWLEPLREVPKMKENSMAVIDLPKSKLGRPQPPPVQKPLKKTFVITGDAPAQFLRPTHRRVLHLKVDLAYHARQVTDSDDDSDDDAEPHTVDPVVCDKPFWKDIIVPFEVKLGRLIVPHIFKVATYLQALKFDQDDRCFFFIGTITNQEFRLWRWDSGCCYVTEPIFYRVQPGQPVPYTSGWEDEEESGDATRPAVQAQGRGLSQMARIIGRLTGMDPQELGFDPSFANAGTILSSMVKRGMESIFTIAQPNQPIRRYLVRRTIYERYDSIFSRSTRVWRVRAIDDTPPEGHAVIVKQSWRDVSRPSEAIIYEKIGKVKPPVLAGVAAHEDRQAVGPHGQTFDWGQSTSESFSRAVKGYYRFHKRRSSGSDDSVWKKEFVTGSLPPRIVHRTLVRFAFDQEYRRLSDVKYQIELIYVIRDIVLAIEILYKKGILHRDLSSGNIMLHKKAWNGRDSVDPGQMAVLIDFDLAMETAGMGGGGETAVTHAHLSGTLLFMARERLDQAVYPTQHPMQHQLHHDLEALFWVAFKSATDKCYLDIRTEDEVRTLTFDTPRNVLRAKEMIINYLSDEIKATNFDLQSCDFLKDFFVSFALLCKHDPSKDLTLENVKALVSRIIEAGRPGQNAEFFPKVKEQQQETGDKRSLPTQDVGINKQEASSRPKKVKTTAPTKFTTIPKP